MSLNRCNSELMATASLAAPVPQRSSSQKKQGAYTIAGTEKKTQQKTDRRTEGI
ncbi:hypothetical protein ACDQ55_17620 [Chitinophaga sp. 30R24]|uniref:hypothetical protein n=1 Tax=Chitinophaga sp. 30R24 TaxID=3248838 RepID=UPI003B911902